MSALHDGPAGNNGAVHRPAPAHHGQHSLGVLHRTRELQPVGVDHEEVRRLAAGQLPDLRAAKHPRSPARGNLEHVVAGGRVVALVEAVEQEAHAHLLQQAGAVVARRTVDPQPHGNPQPEHIAHARNARGQLHI